MQWWFLMVFQSKQWVAKNKLLLRELHFLSLWQNPADCWAMCDGSALELLCAGLSDMVVSLFADGLEVANDCGAFCTLADLFLQEISFQVKFWGPSAPRSNSKINYRDRFEWEEPKRVPLIKPLHFCEIKGIYSLWFASLSALERGVGAYVGIKSSSLLHLAWIIRTCQMQETKAAVETFASLLCPYRFLY